MKMTAAMRYVTVLLGFVLTWPFLQAGAAASPIQGWDSGNHVWVNISSDNTNLQIGTSPGNAGGNIIPDVINIPCPPQRNVDSAMFAVVATPAALTINGAANQSCGIGPNDGHTWQITGYNYSQTSAGAGSNCSAQVEVLAPAATPGGGWTIGTPVACSTTTVANSPVQMTIGFQATPTTGATTPTPTPQLVTKNSLIYFEPSGTATAVTGQQGTLTLKRVS